ncbi:hypothetical protein ACFQ4C_06885 [Larkinella insperata]|uniref:Uncharacterized protein n=1 Tax=Larkinella insperata TaxID=332158 RepID=A0ABW3QKP2_9BACT
MLRFSDYLPQIDFIAYLDTQAGFLSTPAAALIMSHEHRLDITFLFFYN